jgi:hypothetical protein
MMAKYHKLSEKASVEDVKLLKEISRKNTATVHFHVAYQDGYYVTITKVNDDGTFTGQLHSVAPML